MSLKLHVHVPPPPIIHNSPHHGPVPTQVTSIQCLTIAKRVGVDREEREEAVETMEGVLSRFN